MKIPASENPYCASFIEYESPTIASMSPFETAFFMDTDYRLHHRQVSAYIRPDHRSDSGNHENRTRRAVGIDPGKIIAHGLGAEYAAEKGYKPTVPGTVIVGLSGKTKATTATIRTGNTLVPIYTSEVKTVGQLN